MIKGQSITSSGIHVLGKNFIESCGFKFDLSAVQGNPVMALLAAVALDPTEKQKKFLADIGIVLKDAEGKNIFPPDEEEKKEEEE